MSANIQDWRCQACGKLLAKQQSNVLDIHIDRYRYIVEGKISSVCPRCHVLNSKQTAENVANGKK